MSVGKFVRPKRTNLVTKIKKRNGLDSCMFCNDDSTDELYYGEIKFHQKSGLRVHYFCMLFSKGLNKQDEDETVGIAGFKPAHILAEIKRGEKHICSFCNENGATIRCEEKSCPKKFHMPCGRKNDALFLFYDQYCVFCSEHAPKKLARVQNPKRMGAFFGTGRVQCTICKFYVPSRSSRDVISSSCCKLAYFHFDCIQNQAVNAGEYHFRCPNCNDEETYRSDVLKFGVYIPTRDASWETDGRGRFELLYQRPEECSAARCPISRRYSKQSDPKFSLVYCDQCGSKAAHFYCSQFEMARGEKDWLCTECVPKSKNIKHLPSLNISKTSTVFSSAGGACSSTVSPKISVSLNAVTCGSNKIDNTDSDSSVQEIISESLRRRHKIIVRQYSYESDRSDEDLGLIRKRKRSSDHDVLSDTDTDSQVKTFGNDLQDGESESVLNVDSGDDCLLINDDGESQLTLQPAHQRLKSLPLAHQHRESSSTSSFSSSSSCDTSSDSDLDHSDNEEDVKIVFCKVNLTLERLDSDTD